MAAGDDALELLGAAQGVLGDPRLAGGGLNLRRRHRTRAEQAAQEGPRFIERGDVIAGSFRSQQIAGAQRARAGPAEALLIDGVGESRSEGGKVGLDVDQRLGTYLRHLVRGRPPTARWPLARAAIVQLAKAGNNLNQLVKLAHSGTLLSAALLGAVRSVLAEVRAVRRALQDEPRG